MDKKKRKSRDPYVEPQHKVNELVNLFDKFGCEYLGFPQFDKKGVMMFRAVRFRACGHEQDVAYTNGNKSNFSGFKCRTCQQNNKQALFDKHKFEVIEEITKDKFLVKKPCGHIAHAYTHSMKGYDSITCSQCNHERHLSYCNKAGLDFIESTSGTKAKYKFKCCEVEKELFKVAVDRGNCVCPSCGDGWMSKPSNLYLIELETSSGFKFLKFGYGKDLDNRIREYRLKSCCFNKVYYVVPMGSGFEAMKEELKIHAQLSGKLDPLYMKTYLTRGGYTECYSILELDNILFKMRELESTRRIK